MSELTEEQKRVLIAEACGWTRPHKALPECWQPPIGDTLAWSANDGNPLPNYFHDLNAMHEAEKALTYEQLPHYIDILRHRVLMCDEGVSDYDLMHATAAQRAEAFGLTLNLWTTQPLSSAPSVKPGPLPTSRAK